MEYKLLTQIYDPKGNTVKTLPGILYNPTDIIKFKKRLYAVQYKEDEIKTNFYIVRRIYLKETNVGYNTNQEASVIAKQQLSVEKTQLN